MVTCLFTGEELDSTTREEHTIQRSLGGRVKSFVVTSSGFNESCGRRVDPALGALYSQVIQSLGPLLPSEARSGSAELSREGQPGRWQVNEMNELVLLAPEVTHRDRITRRPVSAIGPDMDSLRPMIRELGSPAVRESVELPTRTDVVYPRRAAVDWQIEIAAMKAVLLTFDHQLRDDPDRFTRSNALEPVRQFIRRVVESHCDRPDVEELRDYSLGVQYDADLLARYAGLLADAGLRSEPFGHTLIVSADAPTRTLDAVFWAFDTDPHAFRLTRRWTGGSFTYVMRNGILAGQAASAPVRLLGGQTLGRPTLRRCRCVSDRRLTTDDMNLVLSELNERRWNLIRRAIDHVQRACDSYVVEQFARLAALNANGDHRMSSALLSHLVTLFSGELRSAYRADQFVGLLAPIFDSSPGDVLPNGVTTAVPTSGWGYWVERYRSCLDVLRDLFGLPGCIFQVSVDSGLTVTPA